ncbi:kinesin-like protein KIF20B [Homarus americanus]|uniref:kinesin-like protein KIF20B n=1 Tax=Homarus americanus TaxID=6706 RepID=UPI001C44F70D|nr:kinesin-like protein KIF20B [Homarus americanus]
MSRIVDRLSYIEAGDQDFSVNLSNTFDPCKNLNEIFQSIPTEDVDLETLRVYLRVRPSLPEETSQQEDTHIDIFDDHSLILTAPASSHTFKNSIHGITKLNQKFTFSHIYGPSTTQKEIFDNSTLGLVKDFINGQNCLLFTYGATNSGKTYTVQGTPTDAGILPRTLDVLFNTVGQHQYLKNDLKPKHFCGVMRLEDKDMQIEEERKENIFKIGTELNSTFSQSIMSLSKLSTSDDSLNTSHHVSEASRASHHWNEVSRVSSVMDGHYHDETSLDIADTENTTYAIFVSFAEIYNEYIYDLLEKMPTSKKNKRNPLMLGEDRNGSIYIKGLQEVRIRSAEEAWKLLEIGRQNLHFATTRLNHNSSRSHCIFTIKSIKLASEKSPHVARVSMLSVCDLAGAERAAKTQSNHDRLKEAGNINTSLLVLSRCIDALRRNQMQKGSKKRDIPVPYRDSKLTRLFQTFFLGRGKAAMIVNISKTPLLFDETLQVLKFSAIAKQVAISQTKERRCHIQAPKRISQFSKFVRQSLNSSGRLTVPWMKGVGDLTFGASDDIPEEPDNIAEEQDDQDDRYEEFVQLISSLKDELIKEHKEKVELEGRLREELCTEFSQQIVEIENSWSQRLREQQARSEELTEWKLSALMKSAKKIDNRKRFKPDYDPDEEYVSSLLYFQEQHKVQEQEKHIEELETEVKHLKDEVEALRNFQKKNCELSSKIQEENSKLTFQLAQLTKNFDKVTKELEEARRMSKSTSGTENFVLQELKHRLDDKVSLLDARDNELKELQQLLLDAAEAYLYKDQERANFEEKLETSEKTVTKQIMNLNEIENRLEEARATLSQYAGQVEERDQYIDELRQQLSTQKVSRVLQEHSECCKMLEKMQIKKMEIEEEYLRDKSKLLLELAELKRSKAQTNSGDSISSDDLKAVEVKVMQLQQEKETLIKERAWLSDQLTESEVLFTHLQKANSELEKDFGVVEEERDQLKENVTELHEKLMSVQEERASEQLNTSSLKANSISAMNQVNTLQNDLLEKEEQILQLQMQVKELNKTEHHYLKDLEKNNNELQEKILTLESKLSDTMKENSQCVNIKERLGELSKLLEEIQEENKNIKKERDDLQNKLTINHGTSVLSLEKIKSLEGEISHLRDDLKQKTVEIETVVIDKERMIVSLREEIHSIDCVNRKFKEEKESSEQEVTREIEIKNAEITELVRNNQTLKKELEEVNHSLESRTKSNLNLKELLNNNEIRLNGIQSELNSQKILEEENKSMKIKLEEQMKQLEKFRSEIEAEKRLKDESNSEKSDLQEQVSSMMRELSKLRDEYEDIKRQLEMSQDKQREESSRTETMANELSALQELFQEVIDVKSTLKTQLQEKLKELRDVKTKIQEMEDEKIKFEKLLEENNLEQHKSGLKKLQEHVTSLNEENNDLKERCVAAEHLNEKQRHLLGDKEDVITALNTKVESLDCKLTRADDELQEKRDEVTKLKAGCDILEKEIRAVREARHEEELQYNRRTEEQEDHLKLKEVEISSLEQEVKKLLQQSMTSLCNTSQTPVPETPRVKKEATDHDKDIFALKEQVRKSEAQNDSLLQELNELKNQLRKMSLASEPSILQCSATKSSQKTVLRDTSITDVDISVTPVLRKKKGRKPRNETPSDSQHFFLDSSLGNESQPSKETRQSSRPQRASRLINRRQLRDDSFEYEGFGESSQEEEAWEPSVPSKRAPRTTRKPRGNKSRSQVVNPHLKDQENKSSVANKADGGEPSQDGGRRQRRKHQLYKSVVDEPYECSPNLIELPEAVDSPHSIVRRQLRNKKK